MISVETRFAPLNLQVLISKRKNNGMKKFSNSHLFYLCIAKENDEMQPLLGVDNNLIIKTTIQLLSLCQALWHTYCRLKCTLPC